MKEEVRYRREVLGMPDKYFHKMGPLQVIVLVCMAIVVKER